MEEFDGVPITTDIYDGVHVNLACNQKGNVFDSQLDQLKCKFSIEHFDKLLAGKPQPFTLTLIYNLFLNFFFSIFFSLLFGTESLEKWVQEGKRCVWFCVHCQLSHLIPTLIKVNSLIIQRTFRIFFNEYTFLT